MQKIEVAISAVESLDFEVMDKVRAGEAYTLLSRLSSVVSSALGSCALRVEAVGEHRSGGHRDVASYVAAVGSKSRREAFRELAIARSVNDVPDVDRAFRSGLLSAEQASAIARGVAAGGSVDSLMSLAEQQPVAVVAEHVRRLERRSVDAEAARDAKLASLRTCHISNRPDGMVSVWAVLLPEEGAVVRSILGRRRDRIFRQRRDRNQNFAHNQADALMEVFRDADCDRSTKKRRRTVDATLVVDYTALKRGYREASETVEIPGCGQVSVATARALLDDAMVRVLVRDGIDIKCITSKNRWWNSSVKAALEARDQHCVAPGCEQTFRLEADHIDWFSKGGETSLSNARRLCPHHHRLITTGGFRLLGDHGSWRLVAPGEIDWADTS